jgi:hypothetical protein
VTRELAIGVLLLLTGAADAFASDPVGRYQATPLSAGGVLVLDTRDGHLWRWDGAGKSPAGLVYVGRVTPETTTVRR